MTPNLVEVTCQSCGDEKSIGASLASADYTCPDCLADEDEEPDVDEGKLPHGPRWTNDPGAMVHAGDIIVTGTSEVDDYPEGHWPMTEDADEVNTVGLTSGCIPLREYVGEQDAVLLKTSDVRKGSSR